MELDILYYLEVKNISFTTGLDRSIGVKRSITYVICHNDAKIKFYLYDSMLLEKWLTFHVIIHIKSFFNKDKYNYYYSIFLEKGLYELPENNNK